MEFEGLVAVTWTNQSSSPRDDIHDNAWLRPWKYSSLIPLWLDNGFGRGIAVSYAKIYQRSVRHYYISRVLCIPEHSCQTFSKFVILSLWWIVTCLKYRSLPQISHISGYITIVELLFGFTLPYRYFSRTDIIIRLINNRFYHKEFYFPTRILRSEQKHNYESNYLFAWYSMIHWIIRYIGC